MGRSWTNSTGGSTSNAGWHASGSGVDSMRRVTGRPYVELYLATSAKTSSVKASGTTTFHVTARSPPGRSTRANSASARSGSSQWKACATVTDEIDSEAMGRTSARAATAPSQPSAPDEQSGRLAGPGADVEDRAKGIADPREQRIEQSLRIARPEPGVLLRQRPEDLRRPRASRLGGHGLRRPGRRGSHRRP